MYRRKLLRSLSIGLVTLAGCTSTVFQSSHTDSVASGDRIFVRNASGDVLSFNMQIFEADSGATLYHHTTTFDPSEAIGFGEGREGETIHFRMATPSGGSTVFERTVTETEQYDLVIRSQTKVEIEDHIEQ